MLEIKVSDVPEFDSLAESGKQVGLGDLGLGAPFIKESGVHLSWEIRRAREKFLVQGKGEALVRLSCDRCLKKTDQNVETDFFFEFEPDPGDQAKEAQADEDPQVAFIRNDKLPLGEEIRQELELCVPVKALCREDCAGLCPQCGVNRNKIKCDCVSRRTNRPFEGLKDLLDSNPSAD